jgi:hypothetical protein
MRISPNRPPVVNPHDSGSTNPAVKYEQQFTKMISSGKAKPFTGDSSVSISDLNKATPRLKAPQGTTGGTPTFFVNVNGHTYANRDETNLLHGSSVWYKLK